MTNQERAENLKAKLIQLYRHTTDVNSTILEIEAQLDEAVREAVELELKERLENLRDAKAWDAGCVEGQTKGFQRGFTSAVEKAAGICENPKGLVSRDYIRYAQSTVAPEIRALRAEEK